MTQGRFQPEAFPNRATVLEEGWHRFHPPPRRRRARHDQVVRPQRTYQLSIIHRQLSRPPSVGRSGGISVWLLPEQFVRYQEDGFLIVPRVLSGHEVAELCSATEDLYALDSPARTLEVDGKTVRAFHGCHLESSRYDKLSRDPRLLELAMQIIGGPVCVHKAKVNARHALGGVALGPDLLAV
ncbi:phytanoyl-CoA dioxygenase family protein [Kitasatospora cineracea]